VALSRRVEIIAEDCGEDYRVTAKTLANYYKWMTNVRYRRPNYHISNIYSDLEMLKLQQEFCILCYDILA
jgi:hypothetical protein